MAMRPIFVPLLPFELIGQIADYMEYSELQSLRLVSRHFCSALEHRALSRLSLDWHTSPCGRIHHFPLEKVRAYIKPGTTPGIHHVRHLSIHNICMDLKFCDTPFDHLLQLPDYYDHDYMLKRETLRTQYFHELVENLFLGESLRKIRTISWNLGCSTHKYGGSPCINMFQLICELLSTISQRGIPLQRLDLILESRASAFRLQSLGPAGFPPQKKLVILGPPGQENTSVGLLSHSMIRSLTLNQESLEYVDMDLVYDETLFATLFPHKGLSSSRYTRPLPQHLRLIISAPSFHIEPHVFAYFRHLQSLTFTHNQWPMASETYDASFKAFWRQMLSEQIFVERLTYPALGVEETFITYLAAYPKPLLTYLKLEYRVEPSQDTMGMFFTKAFTVIAPGLEELHMPVYRGRNQGCNEACPESLTPFKQCISLRHLHIPLTVDRIHRGRIGPYLDNLVHMVFKGHSRLKTVEVLAILSWCRLNINIRHSVKIMSDFQTLPEVFAPTPASESSRRATIPPIRERQVYSPFRL